MAHTPCGSVQGPLPGLPCKPQAWASKYSTEPPRSLVEVGDDGVPLGVFERHSLSPRRSSGTAAPQCHLDSWRLTELRTFRQQQRQKEERETDERAAVADMNGAMLQVDRAEMHMPVDRVPGVAAAAARSPSVQLQRKLTAECMVAEGNAATAGDSAMQGLVSMHSVPFKMPRNRPSMHSVHCPALPAWLRRRSSPAFSIPTSIKPSGDQADRGALAGSCSPGGKGNLEENVWAGIGGLGRNGRSSSIAALQTPRPKALQM